MRLGWPKLSLSTFLVALGKGIRKRISLRAEHLSLRALPANERQATAASEAAVKQSKGTTAYLS